MANEDLPRYVWIQEEGPREGFQSEPPIPLEQKLELIDALGVAGLRQINCVSFVNPAKVPQMADAEEIARRLVRRPGVLYTGIWLNGSGFDRALASGLDLLPNVISSVSDEFSRRNTGCSATELIHRQSAMLDRYNSARFELDAAHVFTAFGCHYEGRIGVERCIGTLAALLELCLEQGLQPKTVYFCDTIGAANPEQVKRLLDQARSRWPDQEFGLHLHDTCGMGLANALAGLQMGVTRFDASIGGLGGCPFAGNKSAAGNICTEDLALMCEEMGISTGLDLDELRRAAQIAERVVGHPLPGKSMHARQL